MPGVDFKSQISDQEINSQNSYAESESFELTDADQEEVVVEANKGADIASGSDEESMEDASDHEEQDMHGDQDDDDGSSEADGG